MKLNFQFYFIKSAMLFVSSIIAIIIKNLGIWNGPLKIFPFSVVEGVPS